MDDVATGQMHTVREFIEKSFSVLDMPIEWSGNGANEYGVNKNSGKTVVKIDSQYFRPAEVEQLLGDPSKAKCQLGWVPEVTFEKLVEIMVKADWAAIKSGNTGVANN